MRRVEAALPDLNLPDRDLDEAFERDGLVSVVEALRRAIRVLPGEAPPRALVPRSDQHDERLGRALRGVETYRAFREESDGAADASEGAGDADRVRRHALDVYIAPARAAGAGHIDVPVRAVNEALGLKNHYKNICQALAGRRMSELAEVAAPTRTGPSDSPFAIFRFALGGLDRAALERLRRRFLDANPGFRDFIDSAEFGAREDGYKRALQRRAAEIARERRDDDDAALGAALLDLVAGKAGLPSNLLDWRVARLVADIRAGAPGLIEAAAGQLARADEPALAVIAFVDCVWPRLEAAVPASRPFAESRTIPTMIRALVDPEAMLGIRSTPTDNAARMLLGRPAFGARPLAGEELDGVLDLARRLFAIMREEWDWKPRDLWDVQGFLWDSCQTRLAPEPEDPTPAEGTDQAMPPTNLILYGPPGTGKTHASAREAVRLCGEPVPEDREALMTLYRSLAQRGRIEFVTFHQNFSYEDFVEGLRPVTGEPEDGGEVPAGFSLEARDGVFKQIAEVAASNRGKTAETTTGPIDRERKIFKMSLGRARSAVDDGIYQDAIREGYVVLGWGGEVDWSEPRFDEWENIKARWREDHPDASGNDPNMSQMYSFRIAMDVGSLVVVSDGNRRFRAIGEVTGPYQFVPGPGGEYNHRRAVRWLWQTEESLPRERVYDKELSQVSVYRMNSRHVNWEGLEQTIASGGGAGTPSGPPEGHVLVIDEINRANISKIFGELITLIEPDKRLGAPNALTVRLPYSKASFGVPANLHIIGTMNTADRSIAQLDTALRRRFEFREIAPDPALLASAEALSGVPLRAVLTAINDRVEYLLDREHRIGHAYLMGCRSRAEVDAAMRDRVIPLLQEYFFEDWERVRAVLGSGFIGQRALRPPPGFEGEERSSWFTREPFTGDAYERLLAGSPEVDAPHADPA